MQPDRFNHLKAEVANASAAQILDLEHLVQQLVAQQSVDIALARRTKALTEIRLCPHCNARHVVRHGKDQNQRQRFRCLDCKRTYNILTGTPMARARKPEKWAAYLTHMTQHNTVRAIRAAGIGLNHVTIWRWRHRFLQAAANDNAVLLCGVIEVETTFFRYSHKGSREMRNATPVGREAARAGAKAAAKPVHSAQFVPVLSALDSSGGIVQSMLASLSGIETVLQGRIAAGSVLCSDGHAGYARLADRAGAEPWVISQVPAAGIGNAPAAPSGRIEGGLGLRRVQAHHRQLRYLVDNRCRGVATRYLRNYLGWHRAMVRHGFTGETLLTRALA